MSTSSKRKRALIMAVRRRRKRLGRKRLDRVTKETAGHFPEEERRVKEFRDWCNRVDIELHPKVWEPQMFKFFYHFQLYIGCHGSSHGIGVVATETIAPGETIACIPRSAILTSSTCNIKDLIKNDDKLISSVLSSSSWVPLLIALIGEYSLKVLFVFFCVAMVTTGF